MTIYRMSEAGACARALCAERLGIPSAPQGKWLLLAAEEGKEHEKILRRKLSEQYPVEHSYCEQCDREGIHTELYFPEHDIKLVGHLDGRIRLNGRWHVLEIKSMSEFEFTRWRKEKFDGFPRYKAQISCYMAAENSPALYVVKNRNTGETDEMVLEVPPVEVNEIAKKLKGVEEHTRRGELVETEPDFSTYECRRCPYSSLCIKQIEIDTPTLDQAVEDYRHGAILHKEGEELIERAKAAFKEHSEKNNLSRWVYRDLVISYYEVAHKKYHVELLPRELVESITEVTKTKAIRIVDKAEEA